ncbi:hypothetical protein E2C01_093973 [Portunus trituberculatus]|uniref:Uncharacterized protein n=1 Tax=Portunus trituberculatus TaxID=210409 RepID=A0A5B7JUY4_PORTR|nr:hypothetical protein [Portunus trituberculatus]
MTSTTLHSLKSAQYSSTMHQGYCAQYHTAPDHPTKLQDSSQLYASRICGTHDTVHSDAYLTVN